MRALETPAQRLQRLPSLAGILASEVASLFTLIPFGARAMHLYRQALLACPAKALACPATTWLPACDCIFSQQVVLFRNGTHLHSALQVPTKPAASDAARAQVCHERRGLRAGHPVRPRVQGCTGRVPACLGVHPTQPGRATGRLATAPDPPAARRVLRTWRRLGVGREMVSGPFACRVHLIMPGRQCEMAAGLARRVAFV